MCTFDVGNGGVVEDFGIHKDNNSFLLSTDTFNCTISKTVSTVPGCAITFREKFTFSTNVV